MSKIFDVTYVASLARLTLSDDEKRLFQGQIDSILQYVEKLGELDLSEIEPTMHGQSVVNVFREDVVVPSIEIAGVLKNAPASYGAEIKLPKIVEDA